MGPGGQCGAVQGALQIYRCGAGRGRAGSSAQGREPGAAPCSGAAWGWGACPPCLTSSLATLRARPEGGSRKVYYSVGAAIHSRVVRVRSRKDRRNREPPRFGFGARGGYTGASGGGGGGAGAAGGGARM